MPKISYLAKAKNGTDDTEVTALQIEQKIADIEALLRGMIDEDNLLAKDDGSGIVPISPSNVVDMPVETRPVQQCMKFFGITTSHDTGIVENLFDEIIGVQNKSTKLTSVNGYGDKEAIFDVSIEDDTNYAERDFVETINIELPAHYCPLTWDELWNIVSYNNIDTKVTQAGSSPPVINGSFSTKQDFLNNLRIYFGESICWERWINIPNTYFKNSDPQARLNENMITFVCTFHVDAAVSSSLARMVPTILCRVNP